MGIESIKESIIKEMPSRPVTRKEFDLRYGSRVDQALRQLIDAGDLVRIKRGLYSLSDNRLDAKSYKEDEEELVYIPTKELKVLIRSFYSQFSVEVLIKEGQSLVMGEVGYFNRSKVIEDEKVFRGLRETFLSNIARYRISKEGEKLVNNM